MAFRWQKLVCCPTHPPQKNKTIEPTAQGRFFVSNQVEFDRLQCASLSWGHRRVTIFTSEASHEEPGDGPSSAFAQRTKRHEKTAKVCNLGGSVFADSAPVSNGSEDCASPGC